MGSQCLDCSNHETLEYVNISTHRAKLTWSSKRLKRARRLYIRLCKQSILQSDGTAVIDHVATRMAESGLYAAASITNKRDLRYRIARTLFNLERGSFGSTKVGEWSFWLTRNGFNQDFGRKLKQIA